MALNTELRMMKTLNAVTEKMVALNAETEKWGWLWTSKLRSDDDGSERWNWKCDSERQTENATIALNT